MSAFSSASSDSETEETTAPLNDAQDEEKDVEDVNELEDDAGEEAEELDDDYMPADDFMTITAMPPKTIAYEENHMEVSASPAFHVLDTLFNEGKLTTTKLMLLKEKYTELHEFLSNKRNNEQKLLQKAKEYTNVLAQQKQELDKADLFPDNSNSEVSKLRQTLLTYNNDLAETEERQYQLDYKIRCLEEDKKMVEKEHNRLPKLGELEKKQEELKSSITDLRKEINQRLLEIKSLKEDLENNVRRNDQGAKELESLHEQVESFKSDLVSVGSKPAQIIKEWDRYERQKIEVQRKTKEIDEQIHELHTELQAFNAKMQQLDIDRTQLESELRAKESVHRDKDRKIQELLKDYEYAKERETVLLVDRATLDLNLRHIAVEHESTHARFSRDNRNKDNELRKLKKADLQLKVARESLEHSKEIHEKKKADVALLPKDDGTKQKQLDDLRKEVDHIKRCLTKETGMTKQEVEKIEQSVAEEERLLYEQSDLHVEVVELTRLAAIKREEQAQKWRDLQRAQHHFTQVKQDVQTKQLQIDDHRKKDLEMQIRLKEFAQLYDVIKNERNKCVSLIQASTQKASEMKEKVKIFENEIDILRTSVMQKEKQLQKHRMKHVNSLIVRDSLRTEVSKQRAIGDDMREKQDQLRIDIAKLNLLVNQSEEQMLQLRKRYEEEIQKRNDRGVQLIERNEEVCVFYEKINILDSMTRNGDVELTARQEEIRFLKMQLAEEQRTIALLKKSLPNKKAIENELVTLQIQLSQCEDRQMELERQIENPNNKERVRFIEGKDLEPDEIAKKCEELEARLAAKEEQALEKDLVLEQVSRLTDRVSITVKAGKEDTLTLAKRVNGMQSRIKSTTRQMMAKVSELSMHQANALRLQQEIRDREQTLELCYINMEKGLPPSADIERDWQRHLHIEEQRANDREASRMMSEQEQASMLPGGVLTTAETRPNAYVPTDEHELPIPRPYGAHAPFKPSEPGSTMRHIRKPVPKPIEI